MNERRYDIDWLRIVAILGIFITHSLRFFDTGSWHLKNDDLSVVSTAFTGLQDLWLMPLFFLLLLHHFCTGVDSLFYF